MYEIWHFVYEIAINISKATGATRHKRDYPELVLNVQPWVVHRYKYIADCDLTQEITPL